MSAKPAKKTVASIDTLAFTESLGLQTFRKGVRNTWLKPDDDELLARLESLYPAQFAAKSLVSRDVDWEQVAAAFRGERKAKDCRKRWSSSLDPNLRRGKWTPEEDKLLIRQYDKYGASWQQVAVEIAGRTEHQCSKRYYEVLDPNVRNRLQPWSEEEDVRLVEMVTCHGTKWKTIAGAFAGRPSLTCRNRWRNLVTAVVRGRASARVREKMAGRSVGSVDLVGESAGNVGVKQEGEGEEMVDGEGIGFDPALGSSVEGVEGGIRGDESGVEGGKGVQKVLQNGLEGVQSGLEGAQSGPESVQNGYQGVQKGLQGPSGSSGNGFHKEMEVMPHPAGKSNWAEHPRGASGYLGSVNTDKGLNENRQIASEWKYDFSENAHLPDSHPLRALLSSGGSIQSEQLADYLVKSAAQYNLQVNVHHHHHYGGSQSQPSHPSQSQNQSQNHQNHQHQSQIHNGPQNDSLGVSLHNVAPQDLPGLLRPGPFYANSPGDIDAMSSGRTYCMDPETQLSRFQHFNYLPPLTPVPRLQSSASSPSASSKGSTHHHHHHYHSVQGRVYERIDDENEKAQSQQIQKNVHQGLHQSVHQSDQGLHQIPRNENTQNIDNIQNTQIHYAQDALDRPVPRTDDLPKESDLFRLLNMNDLKSGKFDESRSNSLTPLTQAVQMAVSADMNISDIGKEMQNGFYKRGDDFGGPGAKRAHHVTGPDPGLAFFTPTPSNGPAPPVSQHHPLHYFNSSTSVPPEDMVDEEDEDFLSSWGFYAMRDKPQEPQEPSEVSEESGAWFPFNPS